MLRPCANDLTCRIFGGFRVNRIPTDPDSIRRLALIMAETGMTELELVDKDARIRVVRGGAVAPVTVAAVPAVAVAPVAAAAPPAAPAADASHPGAITSPMVGVAYLAPEPGSPPFVTVGQQVTAGQTVLLIEAMKTFNQIKAPKAGTVKQVLVENSAPVEFGEVLMIVD
jgi:acetyl-CoA carboxylase biotin carboxyl carrier protein